MENKIDRLFREGLDSHQMQPSDAAWNQLQSQLPGKKRTTNWLAIAASISLLLTLSWLVYQAQPVNTTQLAQIDMPEPLAALELHVSEQVVLPDAEALGKISLVQTPALTQPSNSMDSYAVDEIKSHKLLHVVSIKTYAIQDVPVQFPTLETAPIKEDRAIVKITYIASNKQVGDDSTNVFKLSKVIAQLKETSPEDLLADFRDAKNNLLKLN